MKVNDGTLTLVSEEIRKLFNVSETELQDVLDRVEGDRETVARYLASVERMPRSGQGVLPLGVSEDERQEFVGTLYSLACVSFAGRLALAEVAPSMLDSYAVPRYQQLAEDLGVCALDSTVDIHTIYCPMYSEN